MYRNDTNASPCCASASGFSFCTLTPFTTKDHDPRWVDDITKDLHRQFPCHEMFATQGGWGQKNLYNVLIAYATHNPDVGYCQAMAPLAAVLLMHMPEEQAFWSLVSICDRWVCLRERERESESARAHAKIVGQTD